MANKFALKQLRDGINAQIEESPTDITYYRIAQIDDGFGGTMPDPFGVKVPYSERVRISHEKIAVQNNAQSPVGLSTSYGLFALMRYNCEMLENEEFTDGVTQYKLGPIDTLERYGGVFGIQAPLTIVTELEVST